MRLLQSIKKYLDFIFITLIVVFLLMSRERPYFFGGFPEIDANTATMKYQNVGDYFSNLDVYMVGTKEQLEVVLDFIESLEADNTSDIRLMGGTNDHLILELENKDYIHIYCFNFSVHGTPTIPISYYKYISENNYSNEWHIKFKSPKIESFLAWFKTLPNAELQKALDEVNQQNHVEQKLENYGEDKDSNLGY